MKFTNSRILAHNLVWDCSPRLSNLFLSFKLNIVPSLEHVNLIGLLSLVNLFIGHYISSLINNGIYLCIMLWGFSLMLPNLFIYCFSNLHSQYVINLNYSPNLIKSLIGHLNKVHYGIIFVHNLIVSLSIETTQFVDSYSFNNVHPHLCEYELFIEPLQLIHWTST